MDIKKLIQELTPEEKLYLVAGQNFMYTVPVERLNIPSISMADGPHGLRKQLSGGDNGVSTSEPSTSFPTAATVASGWDPENARKVGKGIAEECKHYGVHVVLGPGVNIKRNPLCGRNFEYYSEDPLLASEMGIGEVEGVQEQGVGVSLKHFALNNAFAQYAPTREFGTIQIAAFGIAQTVMMIFLMPTMGIQQGVGPIIGYNWGARNAARVLSALKLGMVLISAICVFGCIMQLWLATPLSRCFASDPDVVSAGAFGLRIGCCMIWCIGINITANVYFQSIGRPRTAILLSLLRQVLCLLPCVWILPMLMPARPVLAIWLAMPISDALAFVATIPPLSREIRRLRAGRFPASSAA